MSAEEPAKPIWWILDTRDIWSGAPSAKIKDTASDALDLLNQEERTKAQRFHFLKDAKLSLGSSLLKRCFVTRETGVPWSEIEFTRQGHPVHGKPMHLVTDGTDSTLDFNVTHQAGIVALAGCRLKDATVGIDIVCVDERNDKRMIQSEGFESWIDMHEQVFSPRDLIEMKSVPDSEGGQNETLDAKIRLFYAFWSLKEAYVKLVGEGLLADWLTKVDFRNVKCPVPAAQLGGADDDGARKDQQGRGRVLAPGGKVEDIEVWLHGKRVEDVRIVLQAFGNNYMIATAMKTAPGAAPLHVEYQVVTPEVDILPWAKQQ